MTAEAVAPGTRLRSAVCETEVVVVRAPADDVDLRCGGRPMVAIGTGTDPADAAEAVPGFDGGSLIGKRYVGLSGELEVLCTKAGPSSLSLGEELLEIKGAKPLPSSD